MMNDEQAQVPCPLDVSAMLQLQADVRWIREALEKDNVAIEKISKTLDGNGGLGLCGKVAVLWYGHSWVVGLCGFVVGFMVTKWFG